MCFFYINIRKNIEKLVLSVINQQFISASYGFRHYAFLISKSFYTYINGVNDYLFLLTWHVCVCIPERGCSATHKRAISPAWPSTPGLNTTAKRTFLATSLFLSSGAVTPRGKGNLPQTLCHKDFNYRPAFMGVFLFGQRGRGGQMF